MVEKMGLGKKIAACDFLPPNSFFAALVGSAVIAGTLTYGPLIWLYGDRPAAFGESMLTLIVFVSLLVLFDSIFAMNAWRFPGCGSKVIWMEDGLVSWAHEQDRSVVFTEAKRIQLEMVEQSVGDLYESSRMTLRVTDAQGVSLRWQSTFDRNSRKGNLLTAQVIRLEAEFAAQVKKAQSNRQVADDYFSRTFNAAYVRCLRLLARFV